MSIAEVAILRAKCLELAEELDHRASVSFEHEDIRFQEMKQNADILREAASIISREAN